MDLHEAVSFKWPGQYNVNGEDDNQVIIDPATNEVIAISKAELDAAEQEYLKHKQDNQYKTDRLNGNTPIYASIEEQLDMQYWDLVNGTTTWKDHIAAVKTAHPKPSK